MRVGFGHLSQPSSVSFIFTSGGAHPREFSLEAATQPAPTGQDGHPPQGVEIWRVRSCFGSGPGSAGLPLHGSLSRGSTTGARFVPKSATANQAWHSYDPDDMEGIPTWRVTFFPNFTCTELPSFQREASQILQWQNHIGECPKVNSPSMTSWTSSMDSRSPPHSLPVGTRPQRVLLLRTLLLGTNTSSWEPWRQSPFVVRLYYFHLLEEYFEPHHLGGKLLEY